jgi:hypothetical protein
MPDQRAPISQRTLLAIIMGGLVVWSLYVAIGAYLYNFDLLRSLIVLGSMAVFLGFWLLLLWTHRGNKQP